MTTISMTTTPAVARPEVSTPVAAWLRLLRPWWRLGVGRLADAVAATSADDAVAYQVPVSRSSLRGFTRPRGLRLSCVRGDLWITVDGDPIDHVLAAGEHFEPADSRRVLVYGLGDAVLRVQPAPALQPKPRLVLQADPG